MRIAWTGHVVGTFYGFKNERCFDLSDGSRWIQVGVADEPACREFPGARLGVDGQGKTYLMVDDMSSRVLVERE